MLRNKPRTVYNGVNDRPTPSTDQLFAVRAVGYTTQVGGNRSYFVTDSRPAAAHKYYVPANSVVVGSRKKQTQVRLGAKRRAVSNPVYECTGDFYDCLTAVDAGDCRVFGVAYDGIAVGNSAAAVQHRDAAGRFSVIFSGVATVGSPREDDNNGVTFGYRNAHIGDIVLVNLYDEPKYNFRGDPIEHRPFGIGIVDRSLFVKFIAKPLDNAREVLTAAFGQNSRAVTQAPATNDASLAYVMRVLSAMLGYCVDTSGDYRNEMRVQLALSYSHVAADCAPKEVLKTLASSSAYGIDFASVYDDLKEPLTNAVQHIVDVAASNGSDGKASVWGVVPRLSGSGVRSLSAKVTPEESGGRWSAPAARRQMQEARRRRRGYQYEQTQRQRQPDIFTQVQQGGAANPVYDASLWDDDADEDIYENLYDDTNLYANSRGVEGSMLGAVARAIREAPPATDADGDPRGSLLGVVASAVSPNVGNLDTERLSPAAAGAVLANAHPKDVGFSPATGGVMSGTIADEMLAVSEADPESSAKLQHRHELVKSLDSNQMPTDVGGHPSNDLRVKVTQTSDAMLGTTPMPVVASHAWRSHDNEHVAPHPMFVHTSLDDATPLTTPAAGTRINIYGNEQDGPKFRNDLRRALSLVEHTGVSVHTLPAQNVNDIVAAARNVYRS